jgi:protein tyrosine/serine phosphatase
VFALAVRILDREDGRLLIHCSAGIHRTGMVAYALLRFAGHDAATAREKLRLLRTVTCEGVGEYRLAWAEELACRIGPSV